MGAFSPRIFHRDRNTGSPSCSHKNIEKLKFEGKGTVKEVLIASQCSFTLGVEAAFRGLV